MTQPPLDLRDDLKQRLTRARLERDRPVAAALRSVIAGLDNAGAVPTAATPSPDGATSEHVAGATAGLGATEAERRTLTPEAERAVLEAEVAELREAADQYAAAGHATRAADARRAADLLADLAHGKR